MQEYEGCKRCGEIGRTLAGLITIKGQVFAYSGCFKCHGSRERVEAVARFHHEQHSQHSQPQGTRRTSM